jgi:hypothetical protein
LLVAERDGPEMLARIEVMLAFFLFTASTALFDFWKLLPVSLRKGVERDLIALD